jgi:hypothetical protein
MKWNVAMAVCLAWSAFLVSPAFAGDEKKTVRENPFRPGEYDVFEDGQRTGAVRPNPFVPERWDLFDSEGRRTGQVRKNPFVDEWDVEREDRD